MSSSTSITSRVLGAAGLLVPMFVVVHHPLVPNWPYVRWTFLISAAVMAGAYACLMLRGRKRPDPVSKDRMVRIFPIWLGVCSVFWSAILITTERNSCLEFSRGRVIEKYVSRNHGYLSVRVDLAERGIQECEGLSPASWEAAVPGSWVAKRCGSKDITVLAAE